MKRTISILLCIIVTASLLMSCNVGERPLTVGELLDMGEKYLLDMNYEQAIVCFTRVIEVEPNNTRALMGRGVAYAALKRYDEAILDYTRVIEIDAGIAEAYIRLADVYIETGDTEEAEKTLRSGLASLPDNAEIQSMLDTMLQRRSGENNAGQQGAASGTAQGASGAGTNNSSDASSAGVEDASGAGQGGIGASDRESAPDRPQFPALPAHLTGQMDAIMAAYHETYVDGRVQALGPPNENGMIPSAVDDNGSICIYTSPEALNVVQGIPRLGYGH